MKFRGKHEHLKKTWQCENGIPLYKKNPTNANAQKLKKTQGKLANTYLKRQTDYIRDQINKIINAVEDRQSRMTWQTVNEVSKTKSIARVKLKVACQEERIHLWIEYFKNLFGKSPKGTDKPITKITNDQLDTKLGHFTQEELDVVLTKVISRKSAGLDKIPPEVWKKRKFDDTRLRYCKAVYNQNTINRWTQGCIFPYPKKGHRWVAENYLGITLTSIALKIYNDLLFDRIEPEIEKIFGRIKMVFEETDSHLPKF